MSYLMNLATGFAIIGLVACSNTTELAKTDALDQDYQETLMLALLDAQPGDVIEIPAGHYSIERGLSLTVDNVTLRGAGMNETVLSFKDQRQGAEGFLVSGADNFILENLAIEDTIGDAVKITDGDNVIIRKVRVEWTNGPSKKNGAYGLYPVQSTDVLVEDNVVIGASDAGIYVGQSDRIIVRNNRVEFNVAGIEIENSNNADVYGNIATNNTGGVLVFNMPNLPRPGARTRIYDNMIYDNNTKNFAHAGTPVASVPAGSGVLITSNDDVEIFNNQLKGHRTGHILISSFYSAGWESPSVAKDFDPYPDGIWIYDNTYEGGGNNPDVNMLQLARIGLFGPTGRLPNVIWDGFVDPQYENMSWPDDKRLCINDSDVFYVYEPAGAQEPRVEVEPFQCVLTPLDAVILEL